MGEAIRSIATDRGRQGSEVRVAGRSRLKLAGEAGEGLAVRAAMPISDPSAPVVRRACRAGPLGPVSIVAGESLPPRHWSSLEHSGPVISSPPFGIAYLLAVAEARFRPFAALLGKPAPDLH